MNLDAEKRQSTESFYATEPESGIRSPDHSQIRAISALTQSGEHPIQPLIKEGDLIEKAAYAIARIRSGDPNAPMILMLAEDQLERIIQTIESLYGYPRMRILHAIDPSATFEEVGTCLLRNRINYCRHLYRQNQREHERRRYTGWYIRVMEQQLHAICSAHPNINLAQLLQEIHPDLVQEL